MTLKIFKANKTKSTLFRLSRIFVLFILFNAKAFAQPCLTGWQYRVPVNITGVGSLLTSFQVSVSIATDALVTAGKMNADGSDLRVLNAAGTALPFWIENGTMNSSTTKVWVNVNSIAAAGTTTIYFFYGNTGATTLSNGATTFPTLFDDFTGSSFNAANWTTCGGGTASVSGGYATLTSTSAATGKAIVKSVNAYTSSYVVDMGVNGIGESVNGKAFVGNFNSSDNGYAMVYEQLGASSTFQLGEMTANVTDCYNYAVTGAAVTSGSGTGTWSYVWAATNDQRITSPSGTTTLRADNTYALPGTTKISFGNMDQVGTLTVDWVRIRKYNASTPATTVVTASEISSVTSATAGNSGNICQGGSISLTANTVSGATYAWTGPNSYTSSAQNPVITPAPAAANGTYTVTITAGCASLSANTTVVVNSTSSAGTITASTSVCEGSSGTVSLAGINGSVLSWESSPTGGTPWNTIANTTTSNAYTNLLSTTSFRASVQNGLCPAVFSSVSTVTVDPTTVAGTVSGSATLCDPASGTLTLSGNTGAIVKWQFSTNGGGLWNDIVNTTTAHNYSGLTAGTYLFRAVVKSGTCSSANSATATVIVNTPSNAGAISGSTTVCQGANTGTVSVAGITGSVVRWEEALAATGPWSTINNATTSLTYNNLTTTTYYRAVVQNVGCSEANSGVATITVNNITNAGAVVGSNNVCSGVNSGLLTLTGYTGTINKWQQSVNGGGLWTDIINTTNTLSYTNLTTTTMYRAQVQGGVCTASFSTEATITVNPLPVVNFTNTTVCDGFATVFTNTTSIAAGGLQNYAWTFGDNTSDVAVNPNHTYTASGTFSVKLKVYSNAGCVDSVTKIVTVNATPNVSFTQANICKGYDMTFNNTSNIATGSITNYTWNYGEGTVAVVPAATHTFAYAAAGSYNAKLIATSNLGCKDSVTVAVSVYPRSAVAFTTNNVCQGNAISFTNNTTVANGNIAANNWDFGDGNSAVTVNATHNYAAASTYNVTLITTTNNGCMDTLTQALTVYPQQTANFTTANICNNETAAFTNTSTNNGATVSYTWNFGDGNTSIAASPTHHYTNAGSYSVNLLLTSTDGCTSSISKTINVYAKPNANFTFSNVCINDSAKFVNTSSVASGALTYNWDFGDATASTIKNPSHLYPSYGDFTVTLIANTANSCGDTIIKIITINPLPVPDFNVLTLCAGSPYAFADASVIGAGSISSYLWNFGDGTNSIVQNPNKTYSAVGTYNATLTATSVKGCVSSITKSVNVTIVASASNDRGIMSGTATHCFPSGSGSVILTGNTGVVTRWQYSTDNGITWTDSALTAKTLFYNNLATTTWYRVETQINSCALNFSDTAVITIKPLPTVDFNALDVCYGQGTVFNNTSSVSTGTLLNYAWDFGNGASSVAASPIYTYTAAGTYNVKLRITTNSGCVDSVNHSITINPLPVVNFTASGICKGYATTFNNTSGISSGSIASYEWEYGDASASTNAAASHTYQYASAGTYAAELIATSALGCKDSITNNITVYPRASLSYSLDSVCFGNNTSFSNNSSITTGSLAYQWYFGDGDSSAFINPVHAYTAGSYTATLISTSNLGCKDTLSKLVTTYPQQVADFSVVNVCAYDSAVFINSSALNNAVVTYAWNFGDGLTSTLANPKHLYASPGTYTVSLNLVSNRGCTSSITRNFTVNAIPVVNYTVANACDTDDVQFVNVSNISNGTLSYNWNFGDANTSIQVNPTHQYATFGTYNVTLIATSSYGCTDTIIKQAIVHPRPVVNFTPLYTCPGSPYAFANNSSIANGSISSFSWNFGDGTNSIVTNPTKVYSDTGIFNVTLTAFSNNNCAASLTQQVTVTIVAGQTNERGIIASSRTECFSVNNGTLLLTGQTGYVLKWQYSTDNGTTWTDTAITAKTYYYNTLATTTWYRVETQIASCATAFSDTAIITVKPKPVADFSTATVCKGQPSNFINATTISSGGISAYNWELGNGSSATVANPVFTYNIAGTYTVKLTVTSNAGCQDSITKLIQVNVLPVVNYTTTNECLNFSHTFNNQTTIASGSFTSAWDYGNGAASAATSPVYIYPADGSYAVKLICTSDLGCKDSISQIVTVYPRADVVFTVDSVCFGNANTFTNNSSISSGNVNYTWSFGDALSSTTINPTHAYAASGVYVTKLLATTAFGCKDSVSHSTTVFAQPVANFTTFNLCAYDSAAFTNTSNTNGANVNYDWNFGDGAVSASLSPKHLYANPGTYIVQMDISSNSGCASTISKPITIYQVPLANYSVINVCDTEYVSYTNISSIQSGTLSYVWNFGDGNSSSLSNPTHLYSSFGNYNTELIVTSSFGCIDSITKPVQVFARPVVDFIAPAVCDGFASQFTDQSTIAAGANVNFSWDFGDGTNSIVQNPVKQYLNAATYNVKLVVLSNNGCSNRITKAVTVNTAPVADYSFVSDCDKKPISFVNSSYVSGGTLTYDWDFKDGNTSVQTSPSHIFTNAGSFDVKLVITSDLGCQDSIEKVVKVYELPKPNAGLDTTLSQGYTTILTGSGGNTYVWFPADGLSNPQIATPVARPLQTTSYILTVLDANGCIGSDTVIVTISEDFKLVANNVFTPNGDGVNDTWIIDNIDIFTSCKVAIFDRWGSEVYSSTGYNNDWDGTNGSDILPDGTYYYVISFEGSDKVYKGAITLLRGR